MPCKLLLLCKCTCEIIGSNSKPNSFINQVGNLSFHTLNSFPIEGEYSIAIYRYSPLFLRFSPFKNYILYNSYVSSSMQTGPKLTGWGVMVKLARVGLVWSGWLVLIDPTQNQRVRLVSIDWPNLKPMSQDTYKWLGEIQIKGVDQNPQWGLSIENLSHSI